MKLEDYFEIVGKDDIRLKGHRIGIDDVLFYYLNGYAPDEIHSELPTLTLEEIYATITYYLGNRAEIDAYLLRLSKWRKQRYDEAMANPSPMMKRLRALKLEREEKILSLA